MQPVLHFLVGQLPRWMHHQLLVNSGHCWANIFLFMHVHSCTKQRHGGRGWRPTARQLKHIASAKGLRKHYYLMGFWCCDRPMTRLAYRMSARICGNFKAYPQKAYRTKKTPSFTCLVYYLN